MVGFEKALRAVKVIKDQIQRRSQSLLNLARGYLDSCSSNHGQVCGKINETILNNVLRIMKPLQHVSDVGGSWLYLQLLLTLSQNRLDDVQFASASRKSQM